MALTVPESGNVVKKGKTTISSHCQNKSCPAQANKAGANPEKPYE
jgi:hypothetical protein